MRSRSSLSLCVDVYIDIERVLQLLHLFTDLSVELDVLPDQTAYLLLQRVDHLVLHSFYLQQALVLSLEALVVLTSPQHYCVSFLL